MAEEKMISTETPVSDLVLQHPASAAVFQRHRIDFCCNGHRSIEEAARHQGVDLAALVRDLQATIAEGSAPFDRDPRTLSSVALLAHIVVTYHEPLRQKLPYLLSLAHKVARVHGDRNDRLLHLAETMQRLHDSLLPHLDREERHLFPAIMGGGASETIRAEFATMHADHLDVAAMLDELHEATEGFRVPDWACASYRTLFRECEALDEAIRRHVHLENHVLMPRYVE